MTKTELTKKIVSIVVGVGAGKVVGGIVSNNTSPDGLIDKITMPAATFVLGSIAATASKQYTDRAIDEIVEWWNKNVTR